MYAWMSLYNVNCAVVGRSTNILGDLSKFEFSK